MASEPSSSSSAGSFDDDRLPLHTIGHATRHTLPPRTLLGQRVVYSAAAAVAAVAAAAAGCVPSFPPSPVPLSHSVSSLFARMWPHRQSYLFLPPFFPRPRCHLPPFPFPSFIPNPAALSRSIPFPPPPARSRSRSFIWKLHLHFLMKSKLQWRALRAFLFLSSFTSSPLLLPSFPHSFFRFVLAVSQTDSAREIGRQGEAERDKRELYTANAVC